VLVRTSISLRAECLTAWRPSWFCFNFLTVVPWILDCGRRLLRKHRCLVGHPPLMVALVSGQAGHGRGDPCSTRVVIVDTGK
jgi:hypothetical protein